MPVDALRHRSRSETLALVETAQGDRCAVAIIACHVTLATDPPESETFETNSSTSANANPPSSTPCVIA